jgi:hypothetical protein
VIAVGVIAGVVLVVGLLLGGRRSSGGPVQRVSVGAARPWSGPARLNGRASVRLPRAVPRPVERIAAVEREHGGQA